MSEAQTGTRRAPIQFVRSTLSKKDCICLFSKRTSNGANEIFAVWAKMKYSEVCDNERSANRDAQGANTICAEHVIEKDCICLFSKRTSNGASEIFAVWAKMKYSEVCEDEAIVFY